MRVTMQNLYVNNLSSLQRSTADVALLNQKMAQSLRILNPSDDPIGTVRVMGSERHLAKIEQFVKNIDAVSTNLSNAEVRLNSITDVQQRMKSIVVSTKNSALSPQDRKGYATELEQLIETVVDTVNSQDANGNYMFSGNKVDVKPVTKDPATGRYIYNGDGNKREVQVSSTSWRATNATADEFIFSTAGEDLLNAATEYAKTLKNDALRPGEAAFDNSQASFSRSIGETLDTIGQAITGFGGTHNSLSLLKGSHQETILFNKKVIGETEGLDYAEAATEYNVKLTALQVTQKTYAQVSRLSLFDHI